MKPKLLVLSGISLTILLMFSFIGQVNAYNISKGANENVFETPGITVKVPTNQVPFYFFWKTGNNDTSTYRVQFDAIHEAIDADGDGKYNRTEEGVVNGSLVPLAQYNWQMSEIDEINDDTQSIHFNLTGDMGTGTGPLIQFRNHIELDEENTTSLKFDIVVENYVWQSDTPDTMLILVFKLTVIDPDFEGQMHQERNKVTFGNAYFGANETAEDKSGHQIKSQITSQHATGDSKPTLYLSYEHFEDTLIHDPTIGLLATAEDGEDTEDSSLGSVHFFIFSIGAIMLVPLTRKWLRNS